MKIFISWPGTSSRLVAEALNDWLQRVIQAVKPFYSPDIDKGAKWSGEIDGALEGTKFAIVCLTPENLNGTWIHYETGALSKTKDASIWTFLLDLKPSDVKQPLGKFQHTLAEKPDVLKLLKSINDKLPEVGADSLKDMVLEEIFDESWPKLETRLKGAVSALEKNISTKNELTMEVGRKESDKLDEILELLRNQQRQKGEFDENILQNTLVAAPNLKNADLIYTAQFLVTGTERTQKLSKILDSLAEFFKEPAISVLKINEDDSAAFRLSFDYPVSLEVLTRYVNFFRWGTGLSISDVQVAYSDSRFRRIVIRDSSPPPVE